MTALPCAVGHDRIDFDVVDLDAERRRRRVGGRLRRRLLSREREGKSEGESSGGEDAYVHG